MADVTELLKTLSSMSPLAVIALLGTVIWMLVKNQRATVATKSKTEEIADNHLHELPEVTASLVRIEGLIGKLLDQQTAILTGIAYLKARINGRGRSD